MYIIMVLNMKVNGLRTNKMEPDVRCGLMNHSMKENIKMVKNMGKDFFCGEMAIVIEVSL